VTIRPEGEPADTPPARSAAPAAAVPATATPTARAVAPAAPAGNEPMSITPQSAPARTATAAPPPRSSTSGYVVQLSAQKSEADAKASFRVMQTKFPSVLGGQELIVRRKDLGSKGVYFGAQVGPFASQGEASRFCDELKAAGGTCIVQRN
jgi:cell division septation protein DedD